MRRASERGVPACVRSGAGMALSLLTGFTAHAALSTTDLSQGLTPAGLVGVLLGTGITATNARYTGESSAAGAFVGGAGIVGFESGIILSSGAIANAIG